MSAHISDLPHGAFPLRQDSTHTLDQTGFAEIYLANARPLLAYLLGVTAHRDLAEDLLQETFVRFLARQPLPLPETDTRRYLYRIATNLLRDRWRRHGSAPAPTSSQLDIEPSDTPDLTTQLDVHRAMAQLKPRERELLWLAHVEGMSHEEIASVTGLAVLSVRLLLFRARRRAAALLNPEPPTQLGASRKANP